MNPYKVCFVICINDEELYRRCRGFLDKMSIPVNFQTEMIEIRDAKGIPSAYNRAIQQSDAKYKVYLHQDTFIYNSNLIADIVSFFASHPKVGLIGVVGGSKLPQSGIWFENGLYCFGKVREYRRSGIRLPVPSWNARKERIIRFRPVRKPYQPVFVVDGLLMITQYDIPWRVDLYDSFLYYEGPQCLEFIKQGYQVAVPYQKEPWCMHWGPQNDRSAADHEKMWRGIRANAAIFNREYADFINKDIKQFL